MDKIVELIGKILEKLTSAKLLWTLLIAIVIFALIYVVSGPESSVQKALNIGACLKNGIGSQECPTTNLVAILGLLAGSVIAASIIIWVAGLIKNKYFV